MNRAGVNRIVETVLYEGFMLYPYRLSSLKNRRRWNFGVLYPAGMEPNSTTTECLLEGSHDAPVSVEVRFIQLSEDDSRITVERTVVMDGAGARSFAYDGLRGVVLLSRRILEPNLDKVRVEVVNQTPENPARDCLLQSLISVHTILEAPDGKFVSLLDPPEAFRQAAADCRSKGAWPVLVGEAGSRNCMLSSPIILYDYPCIASESSGSMYDCTEIDEILMLRILALSDAEKEEMRSSGERERRLLERAEALTAEALLKLHGRVRTPHSSGLAPGDRVRIRPRARGDVIDVVLEGRTAIVESIEQDFENRTYVAVVVEDDPGKDIGLMRQPGHRFFFAIDELEPMP